MLKANPNLDTAKNEDEETALHVLALPCYHFFFFFFLISYYAIIFVCLKP